MVYPNLRLTETSADECEGDFEPLPFRLIDDLIHNGPRGDAGDEALRTIDRLSLSLDSLRRQIDEFDHDGPRPAA